MDLRTWSVNLIVITVSYLLASVHLTGATEPVEHECIPKISPNAEQVAMIYDRMNDYLHQLNLLETDPSMSANDQASSDLIIPILPEQEDMIWESFR